MRKLLALFGCRPAPRRWRGRFLKPALGLVATGRDAAPKVRAGGSFGHARLVAEHLYYGEGFLIPALGLVETAANLRHHAELVVAEAMPGWSLSASKWRGISCTNPQPRRDGREVNRHVAELVVAYGHARLVAERSMMARDFLYQSSASSRRPRSCATLPSWW